MRSHGLDELVLTGREDRRGLLRTELGEPFATLARGRELSLVALAHPGHPVEIGRVRRTDSGHRGGRRAAVGQERGAGERVGPAARQPVSGEALHSEFVEDRPDVDRGVGNGPAGVWSRAAVARPVVGEKT